MMPSLSFQVNSYAAYTKFYGLTFKGTSPVDVRLKYSAAGNGAFDVTEVYTTDGLNRKAGLVLLEDDRKFFPDYIGAFGMRNDTFEMFADIFWQASFPMKTW